MSNPLARGRIATTRYQQPTSWLRCLLMILLILVLASLVGHFLFEAAGAPPEGQEIGALHSSILLLIAQVLVIAFVQTLLVQMPRLTPSIWSPSVASRPPASLR